LQHIAAQLASQLARDKKRGGDSEMRERGIPLTLEEIGRPLDEEHASEAEFLEKLGKTKKATTTHFYYVEHGAMVFRGRGEIPIRSGSTRQVMIASSPSTAMMDDVQRLCTTNTAQWVPVG
jgi:hypothetical protein